MTKRRSVSQAERAAEQLATVLTLRNRLAALGIGRARLQQILQVMATTGGHPGLVRDAQRVIRKRLNANVDVLESEIENHRALHTLIEGRQSDCPLPNRVQCASDVDVLRLHFAACIALLKFFALRRSTRSAKPALLRDLPEGAETLGGAIEVLRAIGLNQGEIALLKADYGQRKRLSGAPLTAEQLDAAHDAVRTASSAHRRSGKRTGPRSKV